jgi:hypothetical protein
VEAEGMQQTAPPLRGATFGASHQSKHNFYVASLGFYTMLLLKLSFFLSHFVGIFVLFHISELVHFNNVPIVLISTDISEYPSLHST